MNPPDQQKSPHLIFRCNLSSERTNLIYQTNQFFDIPSRGVYILFDDDNHENLGNDLYASNAVYMNIKSGGIEECSPKYILDIMNKPDCEHFIWVSKKISESEDIYFCWVYSHEMHHMMQDIKNPRLSRIGCFLKNNYGCIEPKVERTQIDIPTEFEAELKAEEIVIIIFGEELYRDYLRSNTETDENARRYFEKFEQLKRNWSGDVLRETLDLLCRYKDQFIFLQKDHAEKGRRFDINIEELC